MCTHMHIPKMKVIIILNEPNWSSRISLVGKLEILVHLGCTELHPLF